MAEQIIASHKWRRRTRDWSAVCDNVLKLDRTYSLLDNPSVMNQYGICAPACEICVTPYGGLGTKDDPCEAFRFMKKSGDDVVKIPVQWDVTADGGPFTLSRDFTFNRTAVAGSSTNSLTPELSGRSFIMGRDLQVGEFSWVSPFMELGERTSSYILTNDVTGAVAKKWVVKFKIEVQVGYWFFSVDCIRKPYLVFRKAKLSEEKVGTVGTLALMPGFGAYGFSNFFGGFGQSLAAKQWLNGPYFPGHPLYGSRDETLPGLFFTEKATGAAPLFSEFSADTQTHSPWAYRYANGLGAQVITWAHDVNISVRATLQNGFWTINSRTAQFSPDAGTEGPPFTPWSPAAVAFTTEERIVQ